MSVQLLELPPLIDSKVPEQFYTELLADELVCSSQFIIFLRRLPVKKIKPAIQGTSCFPYLEIILKIKYVTIIRLNHIAEKSLC